jgi:hypothetical protein
MVGVNFISGANDNNVQVFFPSLGTTLPAATPANPGQYSQAAYGVIRAQTITFPVTYTAIVPMIGGNYYALVMISTAAITYQCFASLSIEACANIAPV